jgi:hypothetical protein
MGLEDTLDAMLVGQPDLYSHDTIDRVRGFVQHEDEHPENSRRWKLLEDIGDFVLYRELHTDWAELSTSQIQKDNKGRNFYDAFNKWTLKEATDENGVVNNITKGRLIETIFHPVYKDRSTYTSLDDWVKEYNNHPNWHGQSTNEILKVEGGNAFYLAFRRWVIEEATDDGVIDEERKRELFETIFKPKHKGWSTYTTIDDWVAEYNNHPEWQGLSRGPIRKVEGGNAFYQAFLSWINEEATNDDGTIDQQRKEGLLSSVFPDIRSKSNNESEETTSYTSLKEPSNPKDKAQLKLESELRELREQYRSLVPKREQNNDPIFHFSYGYIFEFFGGILLALEDPDIEHQYKIDTARSFRVADYHSQGRLVAFELDDLVDMKSGKHLGTRSGKQLADFIEYGGGISYVIQDRTGKLARDIQKIADKHDVEVAIKTPQELDGYHSLRDVRVSEKRSDNARLVDILSDKYRFKSFSEHHEMDLNELERDLFSAYLWTREYAGRFAGEDNRTRNQDLYSAVGDVMTAAVSQDDELREVCSLEYGIEWVTKDQYNEHKTHVFTNGERQYDPALAKAILRGEVADLKDKIKKYQDKRAHAESPEQEDEEAKSERHQWYDDRGIDFKKLKRSVDGIPQEWITKTRAANVRYFRNIGLVTVHDDQGEELQAFRLNGIRTHDERVKDWAAEGKLEIRGDKFYQPQTEAIQI